MSGHLKFLVSFFSDFLLIIKFIKHQGTQNMVTKPRERCSGWQKKSNYFGKLLKNISFFDFFIRKIEAKCN